MLATHARRDPLDSWARDLAGLPRRDRRPDAASTSPSSTRGSASSTRCAAAARARRRRASPPRGQVRRSRPLAAPTTAPDPAERGRRARRRRRPRAPARTADPPGASRLRLDDARRAAARTSAADPDDARAPGAARPLALLPRPARRRDRRAGAPPPTSTRPTPSCGATSRVAAFNVLGGPEQAARRLRARARRRARRRAALSTSATSWPRVRARRPRSASRLLAGARASCDARDDLTVELAPPAAHRRPALDDARDRAARPGAFQPWEGGEGQVLSRLGRGPLALARRALAAGDADARAASTSRARARPVANLGEARHPLANTAAAAPAARRRARRDGRPEAAARGVVERPPARTGDFQEMAPAATPR